jgi:hypothetical protein
MQMRLAADRAGHSRCTEPAREVSSAKLPQLQDEGVEERDAAADWVAHIAAGRIAAR